MALRKHGPRRIILAVPVSSRQALDRLRKEVDEIVVDYVPKRFARVSSYYVFFTQITVARVTKLLRRSTRSH
jgi:putative phosphoribosyl transferase